MALPTVSGCVRTGQDVSSGRKVERLLYDMSDVCRLLSFSRSRVYREMAKGRLSYVKVGRSRRVSHEVLSAYITQLGRDQRETA